MTEAATTELYDPFFHTPQDDLYEIYRVLREKHPVYYNGARDVWCISRHADVQAAARDWKSFSNADGVDLDAPNYMGAGDFLDSDPPRHDVLRSIVRPFFVPKEIARLRDSIDRRVADLLVLVRERGRLELSHEIAWDLPIWVIARLLGAPPRDDERLQRLVAGVVSRDPGSAAMPARAAAALDELRAYIAELAALKRHTPAHDVMSALVAGGAQGAPTPQETIGMATLFFIAGSETTASLISNALALLADRDDALEVLRRSPGDAAVDELIEEVLRFESPVQYLARTMHQGASVQGVDIPVGARVLLLYGAANRDPSRWEAPDVFDPRRPAKRHLAFGEGIHFCIGAPLARLEARALLPEFARAVRGYRIVERRRLGTHIVRGWERLDAQISWAD